MIISVKRYNTRTILDINQLEVGILRKEQPFQETNIWKIWCDIDNYKRSDFQSEILTNRSKRNYVFIHAPAYLRIVKVSEESVYVDIFGANRSAYEKLRMLVQGRWSLEGIPIPTIHQLPDIAKIESLYKMDPKTGNELYESFGKPLLASEIIATYNHDPIGAVFLRCDSSAYEINPMGITLNNERDELNIYFSDTIEICPFENEKRIVPNVIKIIDDVFNNIANVCIS